MLLTLPCRVRTASRATLELVRELGRGGQGSVYEVAGGRHAVKVLRETTADQSADWAQRLRVVSRLPLDGLPVARPIDTLAPPLTGYVMELLNGMVPLSQLNRVPSGARAIEHYRDTGGLRRRLRLLARVADVLAAMHTSGLVYQDPSPNNIFISERVDRDQVWLIDTDNVAYASAPGRPVCTPRYRAPELRPVASRRADSLSDAFAFAVIAYELLTQDHPFIGDELYGAEDEEAEAEAYDGGQPFVDHPDDSSNRSTRGIQPRDLVIGPALSSAFRSTFVDGPRRRDRRPGVGRWADLLRAAAGATVSCPACHMSYYFDLAVYRCPWCDDAPRPAVLRVWVVVDVAGDPADEPGRGTHSERGHLVSVAGEELYLTRGAVLGAVADPAGLMFQLRWEGDRLKIVNHTERVVDLVAPDGSEARVLERDKVASLRATSDRAMWSVRVVRPGRPDRWLCFAVEAGGPQ
ncbi:protein kinase domain-containing protein [Phytohabitans kaempferiae]|uniref:Protein kinase domain-containing protein n=1 Tax=Phytohabitans kaempferiae TaxID=1620943 RepID=A0ABV6LUN0_9ACTN